MVSGNCRHWRIAQKLVRINTAKGREYSRPSA
jgi:hypothetical protein